MVLFGIIGIALVAVCAGVIRAVLHKAFSNIDWLNFEEESICDYRQRLEMENTEFNYGHNVKHTSDDE